MSSITPTQGGTSAKRKHQEEDGQDGSSRKRQNSGPKSSPQSSPLSSPPGSPWLSMINNSLSKPSINLSLNNPQTPTRSMSPIEPVSLDKENKHIMLMPDEPDYEIARQLKASLELGWKLGILRYENWETIREARGLEVLLLKSSYDRRVRLFGNPEKDKEHKLCIRDAIHRQAQAEEVLAFADRADGKPKKRKRWLKPSYYKL